MIGRGNRSVKWVREKLSDADARIRANAVESLWSVDTEESRDLLQSMLRDPDNRVAGNALLGLYLLGDSAVIPEMWRRSADASPMFRATCAWVMGETGDPRFSEVVAGMLKDPVKAVRKRAFSAMGKLKAASALTGPGACRFPCRTVSWSMEAARTGRRLALAIGVRSRSRAAAHPADSHGGHGGREAGHFL